MSSFWRRSAEAAADPWLALVAAFGGGVAWAVGAPLPAALAVAGAMYAVGALVGGLVEGRAGEGASRELPLPELRRGTEQAQLVDHLRRYGVDLRALREAPQPDPVVDPLIQALVATESSYGAAVRVAAAVDGLDLALARSAATSGNQQVRGAVQRMADRRTALLERLRGTVDEVAEVYTKLLETSATVAGLDVGVGVSEEVERVNRSLDSLRSNLAELEAQSRTEP